MRNITVTVDDEVYRKARIHAAARDTSVSALVRQFLVGLSQEESESDRLKREERTLREQVLQFSAGDRLSRSGLYERH